VFRENHQVALLEHSPVPKTDQVEYRAWSKRFAQWLYGTDHITVRYSVDYDGLDIRKLSPGIRLLFDESGAPAGIARRDVRINVSEAGSGQSKG
jgi:hypothetical protein